VDVHGKVEWFAVNFKDPKNARLSDILNEFFGHHEYLRYMVRRLEYDVYSVLADILEEKLREQH
jgi:hypothetical protein